MKKILLVLLIITGCSNNNSSVSINKIDEPPLNFTYESITINNKTTNYEKLNSTIDVAISDIKGEQVPYVALEDFYSLLYLLIDETNEDLKDLELISNDKEFRIDFKYYDEEEDKLIDYYYKIDKENDLLTLSEAGIIDLLVPSKAYDEKNLEAFTNKFIEVSKSEEVVIDLKDYQLFVYNDGDDKTLVPFYFANFLFSGYDLELIAYYDYTYVQVIAISIDENINTGTNIYNVDPSKGNVSNYVLNDTRNFLLFLLNNFYGLKDLNEVDDYSNMVLSKLDNKSLLDSPTFQKSLNELITSLDDLHTSVYNQSFQEENESYNFIYENEIIKNMINSYNNNNCSIINGFDITVDDSENLYLTIPSFDGEFIDSLDSAIKNSNAKNIYFDIRCNPGGFINDINHLLKYMAPDNKWNLNLADGYNGQAIIEVNSDYYLKDKNYYVITSKYSFSAANLLASIVKDNNFATLVGEKTGGGGCAVDIVTLPNGTIISRSSISLCLINEEGTIIEGGIDVNVTLDYNKGTYYTSSDIINELNK